MIYRYEIDGLPVQTGDIICTVDGQGGTALGEFWRSVGKMIPGAVDHVAIYVGPGGRCVEAGPAGVLAYEVIGHAWAAARMSAQRGGFLDTLYGVAYPLAGRGLTEAEQMRIRAEVARYCLAQVAAQKAYNLNVLDAQTEGAFYCSQLAYRAYLAHGVNLNIEQGIPHIPALGGIVFPQEIWSGCVHRRVEKSHPIDA